MKTLIGAVVVVLAIALPAYAQKADDAQVKRGRYLLQIGGCNDCHTPAYPEKGGKVPEAQWLTGNALGWYGPWGTTYPTNLRLYMQDLTEDQWVKKARTLQARPPMPWFNVRAMTTNDLRALYRYLRHLGPAGKPAPAYLPPDKTPPQPYVAFPK
jgi:mono/diheme cytochrome c family protein